MDSIQSLWLPGKPGKTGVLLVHGFTGSPSEVAPLGHFLNEKAGYTVSMPLLPGHGTTSRELNKVGTIEWDKCVQDSYQQLKKACDEIFLIGLSMGSSLIFRLAWCEKDNKDSKIKALVGMSTVFWLKSKSLHGFLTFLDRSLIWSMLPLKEFRKWAPMPAYQERFSYPVYPLRAVRSFVHLINETRELFRDIHLPVLLIHSRTDPVIPYASLAAIVQRLPQPPETLSLDNFNHVVTSDPKREEFFPSVLAFLKKHASDHT